MAEIPGYGVMSKALAAEGCSTVFYLIGQPITPAAATCDDLGIRMIDVRHEQAATFMAQGYSRIATQPGVVFAEAGPGTLNAASGLANALMDCAPVVLIGGSSPMRFREQGGFQEVDQVAIVRPMTKWTGVVLDPRRFPDMIRLAFRYAMSGRPGPVYLDCPAEVLQCMVEEDEVAWLPPNQSFGTTNGDPAQVARAAELLLQARRPIIVAGSGLLWSHGGKALAELIERIEIPFYPTPQARGLVPDDHPFSFPEARSTAFREADVVLVLGTRDNYVTGYFQAPRFSPEAKLISVNIDQTDIGRARPVEIGICGDVGAVLRQLQAEMEKRESRPNTREWVAHLAAYVAQQRPRNEERLSTDAVPIHPLRLCKEVRDFMDRSAILVVDGHDILNFARQSIPIYQPHSLTSGTLGWMGVGVPLGIGAQAAKPAAQTIVLTGDGAFGLNGIEIDTAIRHKLPVTIIISNNGGWTGTRGDGILRMGRDLGFSSYEKIAQAFGGYGERVERPEDIRPALERAKASGGAAILNVVTATVRSHTTKFMGYEYV